MRPGGGWSRAPAPRARAPRAPTRASGRGVRSFVVAGRAPRRVEELHEPLPVVRPAGTCIEGMGALAPARGLERHPEAPASARERLGLREERTTDAASARRLGDDEVVHPRLRSRMTEALSELHVEEPDERPRAVGA